MKKYLTVFILCISCICSFGQVVKVHNENEGMLYQCDSSYDYPKKFVWIHVGSNDSIPLGLTLNVGKGLYFSNDTLYKVTERDTIKCVMLVCDTAQYEGIMMAGNIRKDLVDQRPYWIKGYKVTQAHHEDGYDFVIEYLDENKKRLPENILVWLTK